MFLWPYIVLKASSSVIFSVIFATRASIICIDSGTCDTIHVSLALAIRSFDISINRYTPIFCFVGFSAKKNNNNWYMYVNHMFS